MIFKKGHYKSRLDEKISKTEESGFVNIQYYYNKPVKVYLDNTLIGSYHNFRFYQPITTTTTCTLSNVATHTR